MTRKYRTRIEVLRDLLEASQKTGRKTRIIGLANLNPGYFETYARFCLDHRLLEFTTEGYRPTERTEPVLAAIRRVVSKSSELDDALQFLASVIRQGPELGNLGGPATRVYASGGWEGALWHSVPRLPISRSSATARTPETYPLPSLHGPLPTLTTRASISAPHPDATDPTGSGRSRPMEKSGRVRVPPELVP